MMHGLVHDSVVVGTAKRVAHAGHHKPRRRMGKKENTAVSILSLIGALLSL